MLLVATNQQDHANIINLIAELDEQTIWFGAGPPEIDAEKYKFWWDTEALELLINYNNQWFPVAIPPAQVEALRNTIDGIMDDVTRVKADIILNKADIDAGTCWMLLTESILLKQSIPSPDEFYLKTGGDVNGYVYSKGGNSGYILVPEDGTFELLCRIGLKRIHKKSLFD